VATLTLERCKQCFTIYINGGIEAFTERWTWVHCLIPERWAFLWLFAVAWILNFSRWRSNMKKIYPTSRSRSHNYSVIHVQVNSIPKGITAHVQTYGTKVRRMSNKRRYQLPVGVSSHSKCTKSLLRCVCIIVKLEQYELANMNWLIWIRIFNVSFNCVLMYFFYSHCIYSALATQVDWSTGYCGVAFIAVLYNMHQCLTTTLRINRKQFN
jgi:hypothetical protein